MCVFKKSEKLNDVTLPRNDALIFKFSHWMENLTCAW